MASKHESRARHAGTRQKQSSKDVFKKPFAVAALAGVTASAAFGVFAKEYYLDYGDVTVNAREEGNFVSYTDEAGVYFENEQNLDGEIIVTQESEDAVKNTLTIEAEEDTTAEVTIRDVNIEATVKNDAGSYEAAISIEGAGDTILELDGDNKVLGGRNHAGVETAGSGMLTIRDEEGAEGSITAQGASNSASIGGGSNMDARITIDSGNIKITGDRFAAIGGGSKGSGDVTINGGTITSSQNIVAAIGSGMRGTGGTVTINGGNVSIESSIGLDGGSDIITINDGTVMAKEGIFGKDITINGGEIEAGGWGIRGNENISINGGTVTAEPDCQSPGIVGMGTITINGGIVNSTGYLYFSGIHGYKDIIINDGDVTAMGGIYCQGDSASIEINGGTVTAIGAKDSGAGIGGGLNIEDVNVLITGGTINAIGGSGASGIGGGFSHGGTTNATVTITGGNVTATAGTLSNPEEHTYGQPIGSGGHDKDSPDPISEVTMTDGVIVEQPYGWDANGHTHTFVDPVHEGCKITETCAGNCGSIRITFGHDWDEGVVTKEPTLTEEGEALYTCRECGKTKTEVLPKLQPTPVEVPEAEQTDARTLTVTTLPGAFQPYEQTQENKRMVFAAPAENAVLTGALAAVVELKAQGADTIVFRTPLKETALSIDWLLAQGTDDDVFALTHKGAEVSLTVAGRMVRL